MKSLTLIIWDLAASFTNTLFDVICVKMDMTSGLMLGGRCKRRADSSTDSESSVLT